MRWTEVMEMKMKMIMDMIIRTNCISRALLDFWVSHDLVHQASSKKAIYGR